MLTNCNVNGRVSKKYCEVCDIELTHADKLLAEKLEYMVCQSFNCKRIMGQKSSMAPSLFKSHLNFNKKILRQQREKNNLKQKHIQQITKYEKTENAEVYDFFVNEYTGQLNVKPYKLIIPSGSPLSVSVPKNRVNNYIDHLQKIISEAGEYNSVDELKRDEHSDAYCKKISVDYALDTNPKLRTISDNVCTMCKGGCCASGKEHAYLSVFNIRRFMDENPHLTAKKILNLYTSRISTQSIDGSCINHTNTGCMLPRYLRSDICNAYYCDSLKKYHKKMLHEESPQKIMAIQRSNTYWNRFESGVKNEIIKLALITC